MSDLLELDKKTKRFADAQDELGNLIKDLNDTVEIVKRQHFAFIKKAFVVAAERKSDLGAAIKESPDLFSERKTMILHGIKIGIVKSKGKIEIDDEKRTVELIEKYFPGLVETLIKTTKKPVKSELNDMHASDLRRIGVTVEEAGDVVVIKSAASEIDKLINALFKEMETDAENQAGA
jgi:hypothetical protein